CTLFAVNYIRGTVAPTSASALAAATGSTDRDNYLLRELPIYPVWQFVNANLPQNAHVLTVGFNASYYSDRYCYVPDGYGRSRIRLDEYHNFISDLRRDEIGYLILTGASAATDLRANNPSRNGFPFAQRLIREAGRELCSAGPDRLYEISANRLAHSPMASSK